MPLVREDERFRFERFEGVYFWMNDTGRRVLCKVTHEALRDRSISDDGTSLPDTFIRHRQRIEAIAAEKYDCGYEPNALVVVLSQDLTPSPAGDLLRAPPLTPSRSRFPSRRARKVHASS